MDEESKNIVHDYSEHSLAYPRTSFDDHDLEVYKLLDSYGFISSSANEVNEVGKRKRSFSHGSESEIKARSGRLSKWIKMLCNWEKYSLSEKFSRRLYKGIPEELRGEVWSRLLHVSEIKSKHSGLYFKMKKFASENSLDVRQIHLDCRRTYRNHIMFRDCYGIKQRSLFHILNAMSVCNLEIGYCQGMSQLAALFLMYLNEEDAFWAFFQILTNTRHAMHGFFIPKFPKLLRFQAHFDQVIAKLLPKLAKHLNESEVSSSAYTINWFLQCFLDRLPFSLALRLWDVYIFEGEKILIAMAYTILKLYKKELLKMDMEKILTVLTKKIPKHVIINNDKVIEYLQKNMNELSRHNLLYPPPPTQKERPQKPCFSNGLLRSSAVMENGESFTLKANLRDDNDVLMNSLDNGVANSKRAVELQNESAPPHTVWGVASTPKMRQYVDTATQTFRGYNEAISSPSSHNFSLKHNPEASIHSLAQSKQGVFLPDKHTNFCSSVASGISSSEKLEYNNNHEDTPPFYKISHISFAHQHSNSPIQDYNQSPYHFKSKQNAVMPCPLNIYYSHNRCPDFKNATRELASPLACQSSVGGDEDVEVAFLRLREEERSPGFNDPTFFKKHSYINAMYDEKLEKSLQQLQKASSHKSRKYFPAQNHNAFIREDEAQYFSLLNQNPHSFESSFVSNDYTTPNNSFHAENSGIHKVHTNQSSKDFSSHAPTPKTHVTIVNTEFFCKPSPSNRHRPFH